MWVLLPTPTGPHLQVLLDVLTVVRDATGRDAGLPHQLKADLAAQVVGDVSLLQHTGLDQVRGWEGTLLRLPTGPRRRAAHLSLLVYLGEELVHVCQVLVLQRTNQPLVGLTPLSPPQTPRHTDPAGARAPHITARAHTGPALGLGHPHMLGLNAGLLGPYVAVVLVTLVVPLTLFQFPGG